MNAKSIKNRSIAGQTLTFVVTALNSKLLFMLILLCHKAIVGLQHIHQLLEDTYKVGSTTKQTVHTTDILGGRLTLRC